MLKGWISPIFLSKVIKQMRYDLNIRVSFLQETFFVTDVSNFDLTLFAFLFLSFSYFHLLRLHPTILIWIISFILIWVSSMILTSNNFVLKIYYKPADASKSFQSRLKKFLEIKSKTITLRKYIVKYLIRKYSLMLQL